MIYFGIILIVLSPVVLLLSRRQGKLVEQMKRGQVIPINQVHPNTLVEVYGTATLAQPLLTPFSKQPCAYYEYEITRQVQVRDAQGRTTWRHERVHGDRQSTPFWIQDQTGSIAVFPDGAKIDPQPLGERPISAADAGIVASVMSGLSGMPAMVQEKALLVNQPVYAYGTAAQTEQGMAIAKGNGDMVLSYRTEEETEKKALSLKRSLLVLAVILAIAGLAITVYSLVR